MTVAKAHFTDSIWFSNSGALKGPLWGDFEYVQKKFRYDGRGKIADENLSR